METSDSVKLPSYKSNIFDWMCVALFVIFLVVVVGTIIGTVLVRGKYEDTSDAENRALAIAEVNKEIERLKYIQEEASRRKLEEKQTTYNKVVPPSECDIVDTFPFSDSSYSLPTKDELDYQILKAYNSANNQRPASDQPCAPPVYRPPALDSTVKFTYVATKRIYSYIKFTINTRGSISFNQRNPTATPKFPQLSARVVTLTNKGLVNPSSSSNTATKVSDLGIKERTTLKVDTLALSDVDSSSNLVTFDKTNASITITSVSGTPPVVADAGDIIQFFAVNFEEANFIKFICTVTPENFLSLDPDLSENPIQTTTPAADVSIEAS